MCDLLSVQAAVVQSVLSVPLVHLQKMHLLQFDQISENGIDAGDIGNDGGHQRLRFLILFKRKLALSATCSTRPCWRLGAAGGPCFVTGARGRRAVALRRRAQAVVRRGALIRAVRARVATPRHPGSRQVAVPVTYSTRMGGAAKQTHPLACGALQQPANDGEGGGDRGEGAVRVSVPRPGVDGISFTVHP